MLLRFPGHSPMDVRRSCDELPPEPSPLVRGCGEAAGIGGAQRGPKFAQRTLGFPGHSPGNAGAEPADKPGSVLDSHSSRRNVAATLEQPTRTRRGPRHEVPIWSCSRWGLPCRPVTRLAVRSYRTISPLPAPCHPFVVSGSTWPATPSSTTRFAEASTKGWQGRWRYLSVALSVGSRRPGVTWHRALWSPDFPRHPHPP